MSFLNIQSVSNITFEAAKQPLAFIDGNYY